MVLNTICHISATSCRYSCGFEWIMDEQILLIASELNWIILLINVLGYNLSCYEITEIVCGEPRHVDHTHMIATGRKLNAKVRKYTSWCFLGLMRSFLCNWYFGTKLIKLSIKRLWNSTNCEWQFVHKEHTGSSNTCWFYFRPVLNLVGFPYFHIDRFVPFTWRCHRKNYNV